VLVAGFKGANNSSKVLLDNLSENKIFDILYLDNDFIKSEHQLINKIKNDEYDNIFIFGQKPVIKSIYFEEIGRNGSEGLETNFNYDGFYAYLKQYYKIKISKNAGHYLCNNIYYRGLDYILNNKLKSKIFFIHIPYIGKIDVKELSKILFDCIAKSY
jgi:pyrrolidone-carboxylate peptidase